MISQPVVTILILSLLLVCITLSDGQAATQITGISDRVTDDLRSLLDHHLEHYPWLLLRQVDIPSTKCLTLLSSAADTNKHIKAEDYLVFSDGMSNGYYTANDITTYSDLPNINKVVFMMMACQCADIDESTDCCKDGNAHLDVSGIDIEEPENMSDETKQYLSDICSTALYAIGNNVLTNTAETRTVPPTSMPVVISSPSSSVQEATTQTTSAPIISQDVSSPSGQQSETSTVDQITSSPTISSSESTSLVSEANLTDSVDGEDYEGIEETIITSATISSIGSTSTVGVGLLPEEVKKDDDTIVDNDNLDELDDGSELEDIDDDSSNSTEDTSKGLDNSSGGEEDTTNGGLSTGAIIGIVIVVVVVPLAIVYLGHRRRQQQQDREELARMESTLEHAGIEGALRRDSGGGSSGGSGTKGSGTVQPPISPSKSATGSDYIGTVHDKTDV